jgi:hypothetical protein
MNGMLKKVGLGAVLAATALSAAAPAEAQRHGGYRGGYHGGYGRHGDAAGAALLGGIVGLGLGAAIASDHGRYYDRGYYYDRPYYYRGRCWSQWRWDPYWGRHVRVRVCN